jgi:hypothetical protein
MFKHLSHWDIKVSILMWKKSASSLFHQEMIVCYTLPSAANHLPARFSFRVQKKWKSLCTRWGLCERWSRTSHSCDMLLPYFLENPHNIKRVNHPHGNPGTGLHLTHLQISANCWTHAVLSLQNYKIKYRHREYIEIKICRKWVSSQCCNAANALFLKPAHSSSGQH